MVVVQRGFGACLAIALIFCGVSRRAQADDAPVERPSVVKPALPEPAPEVAEPVSEPQSRSRAPAAPARATGGRQRDARRESYETNATAPRASEHAAFPFFAVGVGVLSALSGGDDVERTRPGLTGAFGVELPLAARIGLGFELDGDLELPSGSDLSRYRALLVRARLGYHLTPETRLWGALGAGLAGYEQAAFSGSLAVGSTFFFTAKAGLDLSASLTFPGKVDDSRGGPPFPYDGGTVLFLAARFAYELHR